jgi:phosphate uptake regulator
LQRTGKTSFTVTLPKHWVEAQGLSEKDQVWMNPQSSGALLILPAKKQPQPEAVSFEIKDLSTDWLTRELISYYLAGADEIRAVSERITPQQRSTIRTACQWLIGLEIIEESGSEIILRNLFDNTKFPVSQNIQKMLLISCSMLSDALEALNSTDLSLAQDVIDRDTEVDKLHFIITRQFNSLLRGKVGEEKLGLTLPEANYYSYLAIQLERIADHAVKIAHICLSLPKTKPHNGTLREEADTVLALLARVESMIQSLDRTEAQKLIDEYQAREKSKKTEPLPLVADSLDRVRRYILNIAEMTINYSVWKSLA